MKKYAALSIVLLGILGIPFAQACHIPPNPPSCPSCPDGSALININFDDYYAGTLVGGYDHLQLYTSDNNRNIADGMGFTIDINNNKGPNVGALYDTDRRLYYDRYGNRTEDYSNVARRDDNWVARGETGEDPDLETSAYYSGGNEYSQWGNPGEYNGNLQYNNIGNALIIQERVDHNDISCGHLDQVQGRNETSSSDRDQFAPDDDSNGGFIRFNFENAMSGFGFTFGDLDSGETSRTNITFFDSTGTSVEVSFDEFSSGVFADRGSNNTTGTVEWGDGHLNRIDTISVTELNQVMQTPVELLDISSVQFNLSGSGGIGSIHYCYSAVPEASTLLSGAGLLFVAGFFTIRRRRKNKA
jgi:hypothetical protein